LFEEAATPYHYVGCVISRVQPDMTEFLFIPMQSANGGRTRVRLNDIPRLFSEGLDEPAHAEASAWQNRWQKFMASVPVAVSSVKFYRGAKHAM
jgi:hypothetical protein